MDSPERMPQAKRGDRFCALRATAFVRCAARRAVRPRALGHAGCATAAAQLRLPPPVACRRRWNSLRNDRTSGNRLAFLVRGMRSVPIQARSPEKFSAPCNCGAAWIDPIPD